MSLFDQEGYQIHAAQDGEQALKKINAVTPDLILLDVMMPVMDGFTTCKQLKSSRRTKDIPIIFLSARTESEDIVKGFELGAVDYVIKPFQREEVLARVHTHLALHRLQQQLEDSVEKRTAELRKAFKDNESLKEQLQSDNVYLRQEITEREKAEQDLKTSETMLRALSIRLQEVEEAFNRNTRLMFNIVFG